jgi:hypothetical protein
MEQKEAEKKISSARKNIFKRLFSRIKGSDEK